MKLIANNSHPLLQVKLNIIRLLTYPFGTIKLYKQYAVAQMNEGINISEDMIEFMEDVAYKFYGDNHFVYITNRINSYSVNPAIYLKASKIPNLSGFAIVSTIPQAISNVQIEAMFISKPFSTFNNLSEAKSWAVDILKRESETKKSTSIPYFFTI